MPSLRALASATAARRRASIAAAPGSPPTAAARARSSSTAPATVTGAVTYTATPARSHSVSEGTRLTRRPTRSGSATARPSPSTTVRAIGLRPQGVEVALLVAGQHEDQVGEPVQVADRLAVGEPAGPLQRDRAPLRPPHDRAGHLQEGRALGLAGDD